MKTLRPYLLITVPNRIKSRRGYDNLFECTVSIIVVLVFAAASAYGQGIITTVAGTGNYGFSGDGGPATIASLSLGEFTGSVTVDMGANLYIADSGNHRIRKVSPDGTITTIAGNGSRGFSGDGGPATNASLNVPTGVGVDAAGNLYITDAGNHRIRKVNLDGVITTVAGNGSRGFSGDGNRAIHASLNLATQWIPTSYAGNLAIDTVGNLYIPDTGNSCIRKVTLDGKISTVAYFRDPWSVATDLTGNVYIAESTPHLGGGIHKITSDGTFIKIAGADHDPLVESINPLGDGGLATDAWLLFPAGVAVGATGGFYIADSGSHRIRKVDQEGKIITIAGYGSPNFHPPDPIFGEGGRYNFVGGFSGDGMLSDIAQLNIPRSVAVDTKGNLYIADSLNNRIRKISATSVAIPIITAASSAGKQLLVFGENFELGAVILRNGVEQRTVNDDQNSSTIVIGKKAGKKIKSGDLLQVRNPNGKLSEAFTFTSP